MKKLLSLLLCFVIAFACITPAFAEGGDCSLTIIYKDDKTPIEGAHISIYRVAELSGENYVLTGDFKNDPVKVDISTNSASVGCAMALYGYAAVNGRTPAASADTNSNGIVYFGSLDEGLYLIAIDGTFVNNNYYGDSYYLVALPGVDTETKEVVYNIISQPKSKIICNDRAAVTSIHVLKKWSDDEETHNPVNVTLYRDGTAVETVELNNNNLWRYVWDNLEAAHNYIAVEENVPDGYIVSVSREEDTFIVTNTKESTVTPTNPDDTTGTTSSDNPDNPDNPININPVVPAVVVPSVVITGVIIGTSVAVIPFTIGAIVIAGAVIIGVPVAIKVINDYKADHPDQDTEYNESDEELPYTGVLWWPVPVMAAAGAVLIIAGTKLRKKKDEESE